MNLKFKKTVLLPFALISAVFTYILIFAAVFCAVALFSLGLLSSAVSLGSIAGIITVASDLSPLSMLFTGFFCIFTALALGAALFIIIPAAFLKLYKIREWFRLTETGKRYF